MRKLLDSSKLSYIYAFFSQATLGLTFFFYILLARFLGPEQYGVFASAAALAGILSVFIQFGIPDLLTREVAANPSKGTKYTIEFLLVEGVNSLVILILLLPLAIVLGFEGNDLIVCYLVVLAEVGRGMKMTLRGVLKGRGWFGAEAFSVGIERLFGVLLASVILFLTRNLVWVMGSLVIVRMFDVLGLLLYLSRKVNIWSSFGLSSLVPSLQKAYPFALSGILWIIHYQVDIVMLKGFAPFEEAGFYSGAYRLMEIFSALSGVVFAVAFPRFSNCYVNNPDKLPEEIYRSTCLLLAFVLPVLIVAGFFQTTLVELVYGEAFLPSVKSLAIILPTITVVMLGDVVRTVFLAIGREKQLPPLLLASMIANVLLNLILIPSIGAVGAAIATLSSEGILTLMSLRFIISIGYKQVGKSIGSITLVSFLAAAIPSLILYGLTPFIGIVFILLCMAAVVLLMRRDRFLGKTKSR